MNEFDGTEDVNEDYITCTYEDLPVLLKYVDTLIGSMRWNNFGKEPSSLDVIQESYSNDPNIREALGEIDFSPGSPDHEVVVSDFRRGIREYVESQREEPIVKKWADNKKELADYLKNHVVQCERCMQRYADFIVDRALRFDGDNIWADIEKYDKVYLDIGTTNPIHFIYFSGSVVNRKFSKFRKRPPKESDQDHEDEFRS